ncbi:hypothetical protein HAX54_016552 [Datura stramonium]|uniref:Uncharacterized protein n=1 Tax=Datura stramonium TaxID=4076 RepID=A0ABS8S021_DATST|nr:hypothetical protein [Datura stramonium]
MNCLRIPSPILLKISTNKFRWQHYKSKPFWLVEQQQQHYNAKLATGFVKGKRSVLISPIRAVVDIPFLLAANSPAAAPRDLSVLLQTSGVMLFMYWITNFVVPQFILKDLQDDDSTTNNNKADENDLP